MEEGKKNALPSLLAVAQVTRTEAQKYLKFRLYTNYFSVILTCISLLFPIQIGWIVIGLSGAFQGFSLILKGITKKYHDLSREAQRRAMIEDSFGKVIERFDVTELYSKIGDNLLKDAESYNLSGDYYSSTKIYGYERFRDNIQESSFFSRNLLDFELRRLTWKLAITVTTVIVIAFYLLIEGIPYFKSNEDFKFLIGAIAIVYIFILSDDVDSYNACKSSSRLFLDIDRRLNNVENKEELFSGFGDYSAAALSSPPISTLTYTNKRDYMNNLWYNREPNNRQIMFESENIPRSIPDATSVSTNKEDSKPNVEWVAKELIDTLCNNSRSVSYKINKMSGWSGIPVYEIILIDNKREIYQLIAKFYGDKNLVSKEISLIRKLNDIGTDLLCFNILEEKFAKRGICVYYHATHRTQEQMYPLHKFIIETIQKGESIDNLNDRIKNFISSVTSTFDKIDNNSYRVKSLSEYLNEIKNELPPDFILDLTGDGRFKTVSKDLIISSNQSYPDLDIIDEIYEINDDKILTVNQSNGIDWIKIPFCDISISKINGKTLLYMSICDSIYKLCVIIPTVKYEELIENFITELKTIVIKPTTTRFSKFSNYFLKTYKIDLKNTADKDFYSSTLSTFLNNDMKVTYRHNDFHVNNILFSKNYIKIIDLGDINPSPVLNDVVRLEVSLLFELLSFLSITDEDLIVVYRKLYGEGDNVRKF